MTEELRADPVLLAVLSKETLAMARSGRDALRALRSEGLIPAAAFGNSSAASMPANAYAEALEAAGLAVEDVADVLETDADRLLRAAFAYKAADDEAASYFNTHPGAPRD